MSAWLVPLLQTAGMIGLPILLLVCLHWILTKLCH